MDSFVIGAMLAASLLHASWHALVKASGDRVVALAGMNLVSGAVGLALLPLAGPLPAAAFAVILGSVLLHVAYKIALARLYVLADFGQAYPLARGTTPLIAAILAFVLLGEQPGGGALLGLVLVCAGVLLLAFEQGAARVTPRALLAAMTAGTMVAAYSVLDAYGVRLTGDWLAFTAWLVAADSTAFVAYALATRKRAALRSWKQEWPRVLLSGALGVASFGTFMWALGRAPVGPVAALRETSVLFAAIIGILVLKERASPARLAAAAAVMAGVAAIALSR